MFIQNNVIPKKRRDKFIWGGDNGRERGELRREKTIRKRENRVLLFFHFFFGGKKVKRHALNNQAL